MYNLIAYNNESIVPHILLRPEGQFARCDNRVLLPEPKIPKVNQHK